ncbi:response regulator transcription factor [Ligilactobacillus sp. WILCCON 0076]|uniref:Response regulator transcription factor n=1 Tax=Ligilactobacillus ubinensis TaxID=2876789 RepID=A0A9X2FFN0_9LACO|nr:response regulator transcription factor [Ligilactobacillus ubinensis]MCP0885722.1 response regulator transcription factor [Ligilactobacillus ubinensis]
MDKILIIEDNNDMQQLLKKVFSAQYETVSAFSGTEGLLLFEQQTFQLILLDRMLPGKSGDIVLQEIRKSSEIPVIMITALDDSSEKAQLLLVGADDYITKPFDIDELQARIVVQLRNHSGQNIKDILQYKNLTLLPSEYAISNGKEKCMLKRKEFDILKLLFNNPQMIFTKEKLYEMVWAEKYYGDENTINVHISNLRKKLAQLDDTEQYIETIWGIGVRLA